MAVAMANPSSTAETQARGKKYLIAVTTLGTQACRLKGKVVMPYRKGTI
jgi:hypothetical protein